MPRPAQAQVVDADEFLDPSTEPDDANEQEESGALQDALLDGDEDDELEVGTCLELPSYTSVYPFLPLFAAASPVLLHNFELSRLFARVYFSHRPRSLMFAA